LGDGMVEEGPDAENTASDALVGWRTGGVAHRAVAELPSHTLSPLLLPPKGMIRNTEVLGLRIGLRIGLG
jgi:hypothetical protein